MRYISLLTIFVMLAACTNQPNEVKQASVSAGMSRLSQLQNHLNSPGEDYIMVIAHRGDWRHAPENSLQAIKNSIDMGVDMVEIDVRLTKDSVMVLMHDATIDRTTTGKGLLSDWSYDSLQSLYLRNGAGHPTHHKIPTLEEAMALAKDKILINLDKCYDQFDKAYEVLKKTGTTDHVVMKGRVSVDQVLQELGQYVGEVPFMPIVTLNAPGAAEIIDAYQSTLKPVAFEFTFDDLSSPLVNEFASIQSRGSKVWVNSLWESLNAGYEDDMAVYNTDSIYGWYIDKNITMIQTDRPRLLLEYLRGRELHD